MWIEKDDKLTKTYTFTDFKEAFSFMEEVAEVADTMDHHPWWSNVYNKVTFELSTHDIGGKVSEKDWKLANAIDKIYDRIKS